ncbi:MAG: glycerophosphodiester phosphodiesterase family protein [Desulfobacterales bacterium]|nr:glycerophosphodiester phosphodiesterase family protein [Desulfobacterales bacterium]
MSDFICFAHRGASGHAPENTLSAIQKALDMGACWIEVDVFLADNELVVIHDSRLERTTDGVGDVTQQKISYLRALNAGNGEKIPFLKEVLDIAAGKAGVNIELKGADTAAPVAALVGSYVSQKRFDYDHLIVSSFHHALLAEVKRCDSKILIGVLLEKMCGDEVRAAERMGAYSIHISQKRVDEAFVMEAHRLGMRVFVYTVNRADEVRQMKKLGVDGVFTNYPEICMGDG